MTLTISVTEKEPGIYLVVPDGEINTETAPQMEEELKVCVSKARALLVEMGKVSYISSLGMSAFCRIQLAIEARGGTITLANMQPQVQQVFETMKILSPQVFATLQEADEYLDKFLDGVQKGTIKPRKPLGE